MKAISIQQPWAWAILHAGKDIENRTWSTSHRGEIAIHATSLQTGWRLPRGVTAPSEQELTLRAVLGVVEIADVVTQSSSPWFTGPRGFVLRNPRLLSQPVYCRGNQNIWNLPEAVEKEVRSALAGSHLASIPTRRQKLEVFATRRLTVTQGNLDNRHLYLTPAMDLFPAEVLGGPKGEQSAQKVRVLWSNESVETDVVQGRKIFRRRDWVRRFFATEGLRAGDCVLLEQLGPYVYRVSKAARP